VNPPNAPTGPELRDIHLPPAPGWWPPAPGWWLLALVALALLCWLGVYLYRNLQRSRRRRAVLAELDRSIDTNRADPVRLAAALSQFLRRVSLRGAKQDAALSGEAWLAFLDRRAGSEEFTRGVGRVLIEAPYRPTADYDTAALAALVRRWTRRVLDEDRAHA
jgi:hypothetical protein